MDEVIYSYNINSCCRILYNCDILSFFTFSCGVMFNSCILPDALATSLTGERFELIFICPVTVSGYLITHPMVSNNTKKKITALATHFPNVIGILSIMSFISSLLLRFSPLLLPYFSVPKSY